MELEERRQSGRLKVNLPVNFEYMGSPRAFGESLTKDISLTGLRMNMDNFFPPNTGFLVKMRFPEVSRIMEGKARIVWSHRISYSDQYQAGLEFSEMSPVFKNWLEEYFLLKGVLDKKVL